MVFIHVIKGAYGDRRNRSSSIRFLLDWWNLVQHLYVGGKWRFSRRNDSGRFEKCQCRFQIDTSRHYLLMRKRDIRWVCLIAVLCFVATVKRPQCRLFITAYGWSVTQTSYRTVHDHRLLIGASPQLGQLGSFVHQYHSKSRRPTILLMSSGYNPSSSSSGMDPIVKLSAQIGDSALRKVSWLGSRVAEKEVIYEQERVESYLNRTSFVSRKKVAVPMDSAKVDGTGGSVYNRNKAELTLTEQLETAPRRQKQVWEALVTLEQDMQMLDTLAGQRPQLSPLELTMLLGAVLSAAGGPLLLGGHITEFLAPAAAAFAAAIGIGAEYTGKVAVADGKEVAAATIQCAAEAEGFLANAERSKAIIPLCVGVGATAATFALLVPVLLDTLGIDGNLQLVTEIYLCCPLISVLASAVASLAFAETRSFSQRAVSVGNRRFARSGLVGRTWLSSTELIELKSKGFGSKWKTFSLAVLPAPLIGALVPGALPTKTIVVAALAAAESAYFLTRAENALSRATDAVALKARSAAVCDTYANQGARSAAILPFTSALASLCAAATAAIVELPFLETLTAAGTSSSILLQILTVSAFPFLSALFAAAASVSKARCEVDAEAAMQAASTMALQYGDQEVDPVLKPLRGVYELIVLTYTNSIKDPIRRLLRKYNVRRKVKLFLKLISRGFRK